MSGCVRFVPWPGLWGWNTLGQYSLCSPHPTACLSCIPHPPRSALEVKAVESKWPEPFFSVSGDLSASYESIPAGATVRFTYQVNPQEAGPYQHPPTQVSYQAVEDDEDSVKVGSGRIMGMRCILRCCWEGHLIPGEHAGIVMSARRK